MSQLVYNVGRVYDDNEGGVRENWIENGGRGPRRRLDDVQKDDSSGAVPSVTNKRTYSPRALVKAEVNHPLHRASRDRQRAQLHWCLLQHHRRAVGHVPRDDARERASSQLERAVLRTLMLRPECAGEADRARRGCYNFRDVERAMRRRERAGPRGARIARRRAHDMDPVDAKEDDRALVRCVADHRGHRACGSARTRLPQYRANLDSARVEGTRPDGCDVVNLGRVWACQRLEIGDIVDREG